MNPAAATLLGLGAIAILSPEGRELAGVNKALGVVVTPYITDAHRVAMDELAKPLLGAPAPEDVGAVQQRTQALHRYNQIVGWMLASRGFVFLVPKTLPKLTVGDARAILDRFIEAALAGAKVEGSTYRVTNLHAAVLEGVLFNSLYEDLRAGTRPSDVPLTDLGEAVLAAAAFRAGIASHDASTALPAFMFGDSAFGGQNSLVTFNSVCGRLASEMDGCGYLLGGKPPPEPTIGGGIAAAAHAVGGFTVGIAGDVAGGVVTGLIGSSFVWFVGLAFVAWKVL